MNLILTHLQHNFVFHIEHNSDTGTTIIRSVFNSDKVVFGCREIEMHYVINRDEPWILCTCEANTPNANLHSNVQCT